MNEIGRSILTRNGDSAYHTAFPALEEDFSWHESPTFLQ